MRAALIACFALLLAAGPCRAASEAARGPGALSASASVQFRVVIPAVLHLRLHDHPRELVVSPEDAQRGYVVVRGARIEIAANHRQGCQLSAQFVSALVEAVEIEGLEARAQFESTGASVALPRSLGRRPEARSVEYRLRLARAVAPGRYSWPVALSLGHP